MTIFSKMTLDVYSLDHAINNGTAEATLNNLRDNVLHSWLAAKLNDLVQAESIHEDDCVIPGRLEAIWKDTFDSLCGFYEDSPYEKKDVANDRRNQSVGYEIDLVAGAELIERLLPITLAFVQELPSTLTQSKRRLALDMFLVSELDKAMAAESKALSTIVRDAGIEARIKQV